MFNVNKYRSKLETSKTKATKFSSVFFNAVVTSFYFKFTLEIVANSVLQMCALRTHISVHYNCGKLSVYIGLLCRLPWRKMLPQHHYNVLTCSVNCCIFFFCFCLSFPLHVSHVNAIGYALLWACLNCGKRSQIQAIDSNHLIKTKEFIGNDLHKSPYQIRLFVLTSHQIHGTHIQKENHDCWITMKIGTA